MLIMPTEDGAGCRSPCSWVLAQLCRRRTDPPLEIRPLSLMMSTLLLKTNTKSLARTLLVGSRWVFSLWFSMSGLAHDFLGAFRSTCQHLVPEQVVVFMYFLRTLWNVNN